MASTSVKKAGKATATTTESAVKLDGNDSFSYVRIVNDGTTELRVAINASSINGNEIIYVKAGETFEDEIGGSKFYFSVATGTTEFRYLLR